MSIIRYIVGDTRIIEETVLDGTQPITPDSASAKLYDRATGVELDALTVSLEAGLVSSSIPAGKITDQGNYYVVWNVAYTDIRDVSAIKQIQTDIIASLSDSTYLMTLVKRLRILVDDNPEDPEYRVKSDVGWKDVMVEAIRYYMSTNYSIVLNSDSQEDISPTPVSGSDDENLIVLWAAYYHLVFHVEAIAAEKTRMLEVTYSDAYAQVDKKIRVIEGRIAELDDTHAMPIDSETDFERYGNTAILYQNELNKWNTYEIE
jgi:hypothetical protein